MSSIKVNCGNIEISNDNKICIIAGPCQLETEQHAMDMAGQIKEITKKFGLGFIYKTSFDKANRTSLKGQRGAGLEASLPVFDKIKKELSIPILTDIHNAEQCSLVADHVDVLQIPAFLCRQTDLLIAAAKTNKIINVKKGQFLAPWDMVNVTKKFGLGFIYKTSFDKANRTSLKGQRGAGLEASLPVFDKIKKELDIPILTDIHNAEQCSLLADHVDVLQIPAFLCRQTDLLIAAAKTNKIINVKKGQFLAPWDMVNVTKKIADSGNKKILVTERGASFGYNTLVSDMRSLPIMAKNGYPVIFDATHSVQQPGGQGESSGGQREFVEYLARAAVAVGVAGVFIETHQDPDNAPSDGPNMVPLDKLENLLKQLTDIDNLIKK